MDVSSVSRPTTNGDGRAELGVITEFLRDAYAAIPNLGDRAGDAELGEEFRRSLDELNLHAQSIYMVLNARPDGDAIEPGYAYQIHGILERSAELLDLLQERDARLAPSSDDLIQQILQAAGGIGGDALDVAADLAAQAAKDAARAVNQAFASLWPVLLVAGVLLVGYVAFTWRVR